MIPKQDDLCATPVTPNSTFSTRNRKQLLATRGPSTKLSSESLMPKPGCLSKRSIKSEVLDVENTIDLLAFCQRHAFLMRTLSSSARNIVDGYENHDSCKPQLHANRWWCLLNVAVVLSRSAMKRIVSSEQRKFALKS